MSLYVRIVLETLLQPFNNVKYHTPIDLCFRSVDSVIILDITEHLHQLQHLANCSKY